MASAKKKTIAFQVILEEATWRAARSRAKELGEPSLGGYLRRLIAGDLGDLPFDAWGAEEPPSQSVRAAWDDAIEGRGTFQLHPVQPPANGYLTARVRWRINGNGGHSRFLTTATLGQFPIFVSEQPQRRVLYVRGGMFGLVDSILQTGGAALVTFRLSAAHPSASPPGR